MRLLHVVLPLLLLPLFAYASERTARLAPGMELRWRDLPGDEGVEFSYRTPRTEGWRTLYAGRDDVRLANANSAGGTYRLGWIERPSGESHTIFLLRSGGYAAVLPVAFRDATTPVEWAIRGYNGSDYLVLSVPGGGVFLARQRDGKVLRLDRAYHNINGSEAVHVVQHWTGLLHFPASNVSFDVNDFDDALSAGRDGDLLVTDSALPEMLALADRDMIRQVAQSMEWSAGAPDSAVIFHPLWNRVVGGLQAANPEGGMNAHLTALTELMNIAESTVQPDRRSAAMAMFRLLMSEATIRRELGEPQGTRTLTASDYRRAVEARRRRWLRVQAGEIPPSTVAPNPDQWVTRTSLWRRVHQHDDERRWFLLGELLRARETRARAQAILRLMLGGEHGVLRTTSRPEGSRALTDADYLDAVSERARFAAEASRCLAQVVEK